MNFDTICWSLLVVMPVGGFPPQDMLPRFQIKNVEAQCTSMCVQQDVLSVKTSPCSGLCTCGCNEGFPCDCGLSSTASSVPTRVVDFPSRGRGGVIRGQRGASCVGGS